MIIGIAGNINSGKDTVASIINYIHSVGKNNATFSEWKIKQTAFDNSYSHKVIHFADIIKSNLANIFCLSVDVFNNRKFKDELWYIPSTGKFIEEEEIKSYHKKVTNDNDFEFNCSNPNHIIKLRTLLQMYGENCKSLFGEYVWTKSTINQAKYINIAHKICIIPDVRFNQEVVAIKANDGIIIKLYRPDGEIKSNHNSENNHLDCDYMIENNGTLSNLFYKVLAIYDKIKNK